MILFERLLKQSKKQNESVESADLVFVKGDNERN